MAKLLTADQVRTLRYKIYPFIKKPEFAGKTLDKICQTEGGIKYLDWLLGQSWVYATTCTEIVGYLNTCYKQQWDALDDDPPSRSNKRGRNIVEEMERDENIRDIRPEMEDE